MAHSHNTEMPEEAPRVTTIGPDGSEHLLFTKKENWLPTSGEMSDEVYIMCKRGFVDLSERR